MGNYKYFTTSSTVDARRVLYTPSLFARASLLHLQETGTLTAVAPHLSRRSNMASFLFIVVVDGSGILNYDGIEYKLKKDDCVFIDCRKPYYHSTSMENLWTLKWCHFYGPNMSVIYDKYCERGGIPSFKAQNPEKYVRLIDELYDLAGSADFVRDMQLNEKLSTLLTHLIKESVSLGEAHMGKKRMELQMVKEYIDVNYTTKISLDDLAAKFYINKYYLSKIFKEQFGITVNAYILRRRVTKAKQLLRFTDMTIESISIECGMDDSNYFSRMFKKTELISPGEYRRMWNEEKKNDETGRRYVDT